MTSSQKEHYRNLVYGDSPMLNYQTPGFPTEFVQNKNINISNLVDIATAEQSEIFDAAIQNSQYGCLAALSCNSNNDCPGEQTCESGRCLSKIITKPVISNSNGTVAAYAESFGRTFTESNLDNNNKTTYNSSENYRACGTSAEGKLGEVVKKKMYL